MALSVALSASLAGCAFRSRAAGQRLDAADTITVGTAIQPGITIRCVKHPSDADRIAVDVEGLRSETLQALRGEVLDQARWTQFFAVYVDPRRGTKLDNLPPMQGQYEILEDRIRFQPQFPAQPGMTYRAEVHLERFPGIDPPKARPCIAWFAMPAPARVPKTAVQQVYPSAARLPENLLKFYIHFSGPMSQGGIYEHIHLLDASGKPVALPFLEINEELWNPEMTRLTLFIDPGRIKRGVRPLEEVGPAIAAGKRYTLVIDQKWQDGDGVSLKASYRKVFEAGLPDRDPPNPATWMTKPPRANTREPLVIRFPEPLDHALAQRLIWVIDPEGSKLAGQVVLTKQEREWRFAPEMNWKAGRYQIVADTLLEDLAGNSIGRPFEVDVFERVEEKSSEQIIAMPFEVRSR